MLAEWCLYGLAGLGLLIALLAIPVSVGWINRNTAIVAAVTIVAATGFIFLQAEQITSWEATDAASERSAIPRKREDHLFAGSKSCRACHVREYATWHQSFHRTMTQVATAETVIAPFDSRTLIRYGQESKVERRTWLARDLSGPVRRRFAAARAPRSDSGFARVGRGRARWTGARPTGPAGRF